MKTSNRSAGDSTPKIKKVWGSGDYLFAAIETKGYPGGLHHIAIEGREFPIAEVTPLACDEYSMVRWVKRTERFPEPIKGFNREAGRA